MLLNVEVNFVERYVCGEEEGDLGKAFRELMF